MNDKREKLLADAQELTLQAVELKRRRENTDNPPTVKELELWAEAKYLRSKAMN